MITQYLENLHPSTKYIQVQANYSTQRVQLKTTDWGLVN